MPIYEAPGYPDCRIECPGRGYARHIDPYGPCVTSCDPARIIQDLPRQVRRLGWDHRSSGQIAGIEGADLARLAVQLEMIEGAEGVAAELDALKRLAILRGETRFAAAWRGADVAALLETLVEASGEAAPNERMVA
jgi:hypothetical protein